MAGSDDDPSMSTLPRLIACGIVVLLAVSACGQGEPQIVSGDAGPEPVPTATLLPTATPPPTSTPAPTPVAITMPRIPGEPAERVAIRMQVTDWVGVDITMESTDASATEDQDFADLPRGGKARMTRDLGHDQIPWRKGDQWPPDEEWITVTLTRAQWQFVLREMYHWLNVGAGWTDAESLEANAADGRTIARIQTQLLDPNRSSPARSGPGSAPRAGARHVVEAYANQVWLASFDGEPTYEDSWTAERLLGVSDGAIVVQTGVYWGDVELTVRVFDRAPQPLAESLAGWEVGEEETLRLDQSLYLVNPLAVDRAAEAFAPESPGLYRVRVLTRGRAPDPGFAATTRKTGERYEVTIWPVDEKEPRVWVGKDRLGE